MFVSGLISPESEYNQYANHSDDLKLNKQNNIIVNQLLHSIYLNTAQVYLFEKKYDKAIKKCDQANKIKESS